MVETVLESLFGWVGEAVSFICTCVWFLITYLPKQLVKLVGVVGEMIAATSKEVRVWWNPKAI